MKLILHIGQSKTGTTAIQSFLRHNRNTLIRKGVLYPDYHVAGLPIDTPEHNSFAEELSGLTRHPRFSVSEYCRQFLAEMEQSRCHTMILSAESFFGAPQVWRLSDPATFYAAHARKLERLKEFTGAFRTEVIGYFRAPEDWFESAVSQVIRYAGLLGTEVYESDDQLVSLLAPHMDYPALLSLWRDIIRPERMTIVPYERDRLAGRDVVRDFCAHVGIEGLPFADSDVADNETHSSLDRRYLAVKKILNRRPRTKTQERVILECLDRLNDKLPRIEKYSLDGDLREKLREICRPCHEGMAQNYGSDGRPFFGETRSAPVGQDALSDEEVNRAMAAFEALYKSWPVRILAIKIGLKSILRDKCPALYAIAKNARKAITR